MHEKLFDLSRKDALSLMTNEEDKQFLQLQQKDPSSSGMSGIDKSLTSKELCTRPRILQEHAYTEKITIHDKQTGMDVHSPSASNRSLCSSLSSESDNDFHPPSTPPLSCARKRSKQSILTKGVAGSLNRVKLPNRGAMFVVGAVAQALVQDLGDVALYIASTVCYLALVAEGEVGTSPPPPAEFMPPTTREAEGANTLK